MRIPRFRFGALALVSGVVLSGCAYDNYGDPYGYGYGPYGGVSAGYYGGYGYNGYGYGGYGYDPFGWYGDYYYPGVGIYVYDRDRHRREWTDDQRRFWEQRRDQWRSHHSGTTTTSGSGDWSGWDRSHWRDRSNSTTTTSGWRHGSGNWTHGSSESRSPVTTTGEHSSHHSQERADERPQ